MRLAIRLANGAELLEASDSQRIARFFLNAQDPSNGGFTGRKGRADVYYTSFALRGLALLGAMEHVQADALERFLENVLEQAKRQTLQSTDWISFLLCVQLWDLWTGKSFLQSRLEPQENDWRIWVCEQFSRFRRLDGGYASSDQTTHSSTYHTFLVWNVFETLFPDDEFKRSLTLPALSFDFVNFEFLAKRQRSDGGFVELEPLRHSGTNPTVAGIGLLQILRKRCADSTISVRIDNALANALHYLKSQQTVEGGIRANNRVPIPDLLSTFTVLTILTDMPNAKTKSIDEPDFNEESALRFTRSLRKETPENIGYVGGAWDNEPDIEFTFYGLAVECLLLSQENLDK